MIKILLGLVLLAALTEATDCYDLDSTIYDGVLDASDRTCADYTADSGLCASANDDDDDFVAADLCCACSGGKTGSSYDAAYCMEGKYKSNGLELSQPVFLDYQNSEIKLDGSGETILELEYLIPSFYFEQDVTIDGTTFTNSRGMTVTFHDRENSTHDLSTGCFTSFASDPTAGLTVDPACLTSHAGWNVTDEVVDAGCTKRVKSALPYDQVMNPYDPLFDTEKIYISNNNSESWDIYFVTDVDTWVPFVEQAAGESGSTLKIEDVRYNMYSIPFVVRWPQSITLTASPVKSVARMVVLYAVVTTTMLDIDFDAGSGSFSEMNIQIQTQTQHPFGLRNEISGTYGPTILNDGPDGPTADKPHGGATIAWVGDGTDPNTCLPSTDPSFDGYCVQTWNMKITPLSCDVSGYYEIDFVAMCYDVYSADHSCPLDDIAAVGGKTYSNAYSGPLGFIITAQAFCPEVIDTISVELNAYKYTDEAMTTAADPGVNLFSNDYVYWYINASVSSSKYSGADNDDSLVEYIRLTDLKLHVDMAETNLQFLPEMTHGDISGYNNDDTYTIQLCNATETAFDYSGFGNNQVLSTTSEGCDDQIYQTATSIMDFSIISQSGDDYEPTILMKFRLDERAVPVDLMNTGSGAVVTLQGQVEIFYKNVATNPSVRRMLRQEVRTEVRRRMQNEQPGLQTGSISESVGIFPKPVEQTICPIDSYAPFYGYRFELPVLEKPQSAQAHSADIKYQIASSMQTTSGDIEMRKIDVCDDSECVEWYPTSGDEPVAEKIAYYVDFADGKDFAKFENQIFSIFPTVLSVESAVCSSALNAEFNMYRPNLEIPTVDDSASMLSVFFVLFCILSMLA